MKKVLSLICIFCLIFALTGCSFSKTPLTADSFKAYFDDSWTITDARDYAEIAEDSKLDVLDDIYVSANNDTYYEIWFYDFIDVESAKTMYNESLELVKDFIEGSNVKTTSEISGQNYIKFIGNNSSQTWIITQVEDTVLYVEVANSNVEAVKEVIKGLGY